QPAKLGPAMALEKSTLSRNSARLVELGWVQIHHHPDDRGVLLTLTARGNQVLLQALPAWEQAQHQAKSVVAGALPDLQACLEALCRPDFFFLVLLYLQPDGLRGRDQLQHDNPAKGDHGGPALPRRDRRRADHARPPRQPRRGPTPAAKRLGVGPLR